MKRAYRNIITSISVASVLALSFVLYQPATKVQASMKSEIKSGMGNANPGGTAPSDVGTVITDITNVMFFIIGAVSVIMLIYGGIRYTTSGGNATAVTSAKNTIMYSIVGLVIAILAYAVVNFVVSGLME